MSSSCLLFIFNFSDLFDGGVWTNVTRTAEEHGLTPLVSELKLTMLNARETSTVTSYSFYWEKWSAWCHNLDLNPLMVNQEHIALYLLTLYQEAKSAATIKQTFYAIQWGHKLHGSEINPCDSDWLRLCLDALERKCQKITNRKEPLTTEMIDKLLDKHASQSASVADLRLVTMCVLGFAGFFRFSELVNIRRSDIKFFDMYINIFVTRSKTDVYRDGAWVLIARTNSSRCPYNLLKRYLEVAKIQDNNSDEFIFRSVFWSKKQNCYCLRSNKSVHISYTRIREVFLRSLDDIGYDSKKFGLHSMRSGGASAAANNGINDRLFKAHGRWKSENAKDMYVKDSIDRKLSVSLGLGL